MKTAFKIVIICIAMGLAAFLVLPPTMTVILCEDEILNVDDCRSHLSEKYSKTPMFKHFSKLYPESSSLSLGTDKFNAIGIDASSILDEKIYAFLHLNLNNSTLTYQCHNHNLGDDYLIMEIINPTINDLDDNNCGVLTKLLDKSEFESYENKHLGFKIKYPKGFEIEETYNNTNYKILDPITNDTLVGVSDKVRFSSDLSKFYKSPDVPLSFSIRSHEQISSIEEIRQMIKNNPPFPLETTKLGGVEAWRATIGNQSDFHDGDSIFTVYENKSYSISFVYPKEQNYKYKLSIDYIIDSFEFINEK